MKKVVLTALALVFAFSISAFAAPSFSIGEVDDGRVIGAVSSEKPLGEIRIYIDGRRAKCGLYIGSKSETNLNGKWYADTNKRNWKRLEIQQRQGKRWKKIYRFNR